MEIIVLTKIIGVLWYIQLVEICDSTFCIIWVHSVGFMECSDCLCFVEMLILTSRDVPQDPLC
jgi:hypothetical protein